MTLKILETFNDFTWRFEVWISVSTFVMVVAVSTLQSVVDVLFYIINRIYILLSCCY